MKFGPIATLSAEGAILAHSIQHGGGLFKKGHMLTESDITALVEHGIDTVTVAQLEDGDVPENEAATLLAEALAGDGSRIASAFTGRANLYSTVPGVFVVRSDAINAINSIDEALTVATLPAFDPVDRNTMLATVKIIPYAVRRSSLDAALSLAKALGPVIEVAPYRSMKVGLISTSLRQTKASIHQKNRVTLEDRLLPTGAQIISEQIVEHSMPAIGEAIVQATAIGSDIILIYSASAIADRNDVVPAGLTLVGGEIQRFGMPVDPGNLLMLGSIGRVPVVGLPGCARSPKLNGFDWVLQRLLSGVGVSGDSIARMGVGGLLKEIPSRPQPRSERQHGSPQSGPVAVVILAAGRSTRMGSTKQLADVSGLPMVRHAAMTALQTKAHPVVVVTGHESEAVAAALSGLNVSIIHNSSFANGLSTSLIAGLDALPSDARGVLIMLADMPLLTPQDLTLLTEGFEATDGRGIIVATHCGKKGNPVIWPASFFDDIRSLKGDAGAKSILIQHSDAVCEVEIGPGALVDIDTPSDLGKVARVLPR